MLDLGSHNHLYLADIFFQTALTIGGQAQILSGQIEIAPDTQFVLEDDAVLCLGLDDPNNAVICNGLLRARGNARIENTYISVAEARFEENVFLASNLIDAHQCRPTGQFYVEGSVSATDNEIYADGDRYLDLDASVFSGTISNNRIYVTLTEGTGITYGGLLRSAGIRHLLSQSPVCCGRFPGARLRLVMQRTGRSNDSSSARTRR